MYAVVSFLGKQIKIEEGKNIKVPFYDKKVGSKIKLENVLFLMDGKKEKIGNPYIKSLSIDAKIIAHNFEDKILVYKKKRRKGYEKKNGHKQPYTMIKVDKFSSKKTTTKKANSSTKKTSSKTKKTTVKK
tara:strand:+ start:1877 stop:2266 length:390 start_codon:yes stop_codon:yes gene_type:complete